MMYKNVWYVAGFSEKLSDRPKPIKMLGREFVLFRDADGKAACLSSVCPHRGASLAQGKCHEDGTIACVFHGWRFRSDGQCIRIPSQQNPEADIPAAAKVDAYPTQELDGLIWVFLGDEPEAALPPVRMPETEDPAWRRVSYSDKWHANIHYTKMVDLDQVHLPIVHGFGLGGDNPNRPAEHQVQWLDNGFCTEIVNKPVVTQGSWQKLRSTETSVKSRLAFLLPGFTLRGQIEIGGQGSGFYNLFYSMSTPIDEENTQMYWVIFRSFMLEPDHDEEHLKRNLRNIYQDKAVCQGIRPKRAPDIEDFPPIKIDREDRLMPAYWQMMRDLRDRGWQIDRMKLDELERDGECRTIPSPGRRINAGGWIYRPVPFLEPRDGAGRRELLRKGVA
jgi:phenylpropionate dioxygenase-like ring-hydroxylating dioxygenase large terminal subunit